jgi:hypothetical protein
MEDDVMLQLIIPALESYDETKNEFIIAKEQILQVEHSLVSISKWESKWNKPFLAKEPKTNEETIDYIRCMIITQNVKKEVYDNITTENINDINSYIEASMSATWFNDNKNKSTSKEIITSEIIYYWMITYNIPFECRKWHLNRLLTLIQVCEKKNAPNKKMSNSEIISKNRELNNARRKQANTKG